MVQADLPGCVCVCVCCHGCTSAICQEMEKVGAFLIGDVLCLCSAFRDPHLVL